MRRQTYLKIPDEISPNATDFLWGLHFQNLFLALISDKNQMMQVIFLDEA